MDNGQVLALFKKGLKEFDIENHNPILNSLWVSKSDLELDGHSISDIAD